MDYRLEERIIVVEEEGCLTFLNGGAFASGPVEEALEDDGPRRYYRNRCLCEGMMNFNMMDPLGFGIRKMFNIQRNRFHPLHDYRFDKGKGEVKVII